MGNFKVYSAAEREEFWKEDAKMSEFFHSKEWIEHCENIEWHTQNKHGYPYKHTIGTPVQGGTEYTITANGKTAKVVVKNENNTNAVFSRAVAKLFAK